MMRGFALLEVMVASLLLAMGVAAALTLHLQGLHSLALAGQRYRAQLHGQSVAHVLRLQNSPDLSVWQRRVAADLPQGTLTLQAGTEPGVQQVLVQWGSASMQEQVVIDVLP